MSGKDIKGAINYNEQKVEEGTAVCIFASMFLKDAAKLSFHEKLNRFSDLNERNQRATTNTIHISLNFALTERHSVDKLNAIASTYMEKIGFGDQPFLVYEHKDAAHQHVHIVSTLIQPDGKRIEIHNLGRNKSEKARKEIEKDFYLVPASGRQLKDANEITKAVYGKTPSFRSISNIVRHVTRQYKYTSLPELNAALKQFNVVADRGSEKSQMFSKGGLLYWMTGEQGNKVGVPVKASRIYTQPMLRFLEKQFKINEALRIPHKETLRAAIERVFTHRIKDQDQFVQELAAQNIVAIFRSNAEGRVYGLTFVDNRTKSVFKGSDLGKSFSAGAITERFGIVPIQTASEKIATKVRPEETATRDGGQSSHKPKVSHSDDIVPISSDDLTPANALIEDLMHAEEQRGSGNVRPRKKRKRRKRIDPQ